jgi:flagellar biosynthesis GTPase FlhF
VKNLPWHAASTAAPASSSASAAPPVLYYFDAELLLPVKLANGSKDIGLPIDIDECKKLGKVVATFPDGHVATIDVAVSDLEKILACSKAGKGPGDLWFMEHTVTHNIVTIKQTNRSKPPACDVLSEKQVCMVKANLFSPIEDERSQQAESHPAVVAGVEFLGQIALKYCQGKLEKSQLMNERNEMLESKGLSAVRKRPAAAASGEASKAKKNKSVSSEKLAAATSEHEEEEDAEEEDENALVAGEDEQEDDEEEHSEQEQTTEKSQPKPQADKKLNQPSEKTQVAKKRPSAAQARTGLPNGWSISMPKATTGTEDAMAKFFTM